jgi:hypothetical protein
VERTLQEHVTANVLPSKISLLQENRLVHAGCVPQVRVLVLAYITFFILSLLIYRLLLKMLLLMVPRVLVE